MVKKKSVPIPENFVVYVTTGGAYLAGNEVTRKNGELMVEDPVLVTNSKDGTGYDFVPIQFVASGQFFRLYTSGLAGDLGMPAGMVAWYKKYRERRATQLQNQP